MTSLLKLLFPCMFVLFISAANAQQINNTDTTAAKVAEDSIVNKKFPPITIPARYRNARKRNPYLACFLSVWVPGVGQIYNKQYTKAGIIITVESISFVTTVGVAFNNLSEHNHKSAIAYLIPFFAAVCYAAIDAPVSAVRLNEKYHLGRKKRDLSSLHFSPDIINTDNGSRGKTAFGLSLVLR